MMAIRCRIKLISKHCVKKLTTNQFFQTSFWNQALGKGIPKLHQNKRASVIPICSEFFGPPNKTPLEMKVYCRNLQQYLEERKYEHRQEMTKLSCLQEHRWLTSCHRSRYYPTSRLEDSRVIASQQMR